MMKNKKKYVSPESGEFLISGSVMLADSGNTTSGFDDGGVLPGWDEGNTTSSFLNGGVLPDFD